MNSFRCLPLPALLLAACLFSGCAKTPDDYARIAKSGASYEKRAAAVDALAAANNQALLADIAANAGNSDTRNDAARKLTDPLLLADLLAKNTGSYFTDRVVSEMLQKINDPQTLAALARDADNMTVRAEAALALNDQPLLAALIQNHPDGIFYLPRELLDNVIAKLTDQPALAAIVQTRQLNPATRKSAAGKLTDQKLLAAITRDINATPDLLILLLNKLDDTQPENQRYFATIATSNADTTIRLAAVQKLTDQKLLAAIVNNANASRNETMPMPAPGAPLSRDEFFAQARQRADQRRRDAENSTIAAAASKKLTDQTLLASVAMQDATAVEKITDQNLLAEIAKTKTTRTFDAPPATIAAVNKITDQNLLADIALHAGQSAIRDRAFEKLTAPQPLALVAKQAEDDTTRRAAVEKLADTPALLDIAATANPADDSTWLALDKLAPDQPTLAALARDANATIPARLFALWRLDDRALLATIAKTATDEHLRNAATAKLSGNPQPTAPESLPDLIKTGKLLARISNAFNQGAYASLNITLCKTVPWTLTVSIPAGTRFSCDDPTVQGMVTTKDTVITPTPAPTTDTATTKTYWINESAPALYASMGKRIPGKNETLPYAPSPLPGNADLKKLAATLNSKYAKNDPTPYATAQAALWIVTDDASYSSLQSLILETTHYDPATRGPVTNTEQIINAPDIAAAMRLCAEAGIDIKHKRIWNSRDEIHAALKSNDTELKTWLENFMKP